MTPCLIIFTDIGDTIIDESSEIRNEPYGVVLRASCIPGARETMLELHRQGYPIVMVADGMVESFHNTMKQNGLTHIFSAEVISEALNSQKPASRMFQAAMDQLHLSDADKQRIIMVGNNVERDVAGANRFGIHSVLLDWSPRYRYEPENKQEVPDYRIHSPADLLTLVEKLNAQLNQECKKAAV